MAEKRVSPAALAALREALSNLYWFKSELRSFIEDATGERRLLAEINWDGQVKRESVRQFVAALSENQHVHFDVLVALLLATAEHSDPIHLKSLEDGEDRYQRAIISLTALKALVEPYRSQRSDAEEASRRREQQARVDAKQREFAQTLGNLRGALDSYRVMDPQRRGYELERLLNETFRAFDVDCRGPFRNTGEQIDGAFTLDGTEFLIEAKWQSAPATTPELAIFEAKVGGKLDNTLGLFVSMEGFGNSSVTLGHQGARPKVLCMDGGDVVAVLEGRITLPLLLARKKQWAAQTGQVFVTAWELLSS